MIKIWLFYALNVTAMIHIKYTRLEDTNDAALVERYLPLLPKGMQDKIRRYRRIQDAQASLLGKLLLLEALKPFGYGQTILGQLKYNEQNRPYLDAPVDFNISHSHEYVVTVASEQGRVGIDIERMHPIKLSEFAAIFTTKEMDQIAAAPDVEHAFFTLWTQKEALIKGDGRGMSLPLQEIVVNDNSAYIEGQQWFLTPIAIMEGYLAHLATDWIVEMEGLIVERVQY